MWTFSAFQPVDSPPILPDQIDERLSEGNLCWFSCDGNPRELPTIFVVIVLLLKQTTTKN